MYLFTYLFIYLFTYLFTYCFAAENICFVIFVSPNLNEKRIVTTFYLNDMHIFLETTYSTSDFDPY